MKNYQTPRFCSAWCNHEVINFKSRKISHKQNHFRRRNFSRSIWKGIIMMNIYPIWWFHCFAWARAGSRMEGGGRQKVCFQTQIVFFFQMLRKNCSTSIPNLWKWNDEAERKKTVDYFHNALNYFSRNFHSFHELENHAHTQITSAYDCV